eukprot:snap_masked-scaffold_15-processed-gene-6.12-mRNA-1 protein AED:1.00 eAED:1.00 QI:0/-1/0/0/-1/1/1/0/97
MKKKNKDVQASLKNASTLIKKEKLMRRSWGYKWGPVFQPKTPNFFHLEEAIKRKQKEKLESEQAVKRISCKKTESLETWSYISQHNKKRAIDLFPAF